MPDLPNETDFDALRAKVLNVDEIYVNGEPIGSSLPPSTVQSLGARGAVSDVGLVPGKALYRYDTVVNGIEKTVVTRSDNGGIGAQLLATTSSVPVHMSYGQSWAIQAHRTAAWLGDTEFESFVTPMTTSLGLARILPTRSGMFFPGDLTNDIRGLDRTSEVNVSRAMGLALARMRRTDGSAEKPLLEFNMGYSGSGMDFGAGGGLRASIASTAWVNGMRIARSLPATLAYYDRTPSVESVSWIQGGDINKDYAGNYQDLADMCAQFDVMTTVDTADIPGAPELAAYVKPLNFYIGQRGPESGDTTARLVARCARDFCRANANGRSFLFAPWYWGRFKDPARGEGGDGNPPQPSFTHLDAVSTVLLGEMMARAKHTVEDRGVPWRPLDRPIGSGGAITRVGQTLSIPIAMPSADIFSDKLLQVDGFNVPMMPDWGFRVKRGDTFLGIGRKVVTTVPGGPHSIELTINETLAFNDVLEVSYAQYGPGGTPGQFGGALGNIKVSAGPSCLIKGRMEDHWLVSFIESIRVVNSAAGAVAVDTPVPVFPNIPRFNSLPVITGIAQAGQTITATTGNLVNGTVSAREWLRMPEEVIEGATGASYTLTTADVGYVIRHRVYATGADGNAEKASLAFGPVAPAANSPPIFQSRPMISGVAEQGETLTASTGNILGATSFTREWLRANVPIVGATADTYTLTAADVGNAIRHRVTATNANGSTPEVSLAVGPITVPGSSPPVFLRAPAITGTPQVGQTLTASTGNINGGTVSARQWLRKGVPIPGATGATYTLTGDDLGFAIRHMVTASNSGGLSTDSYSAVVGPVTA